MTTPDYGDCNHEDSIEEGVQILARQAYKDKEWVVFQCDDCFDFCLATKEGLEKRDVVQTASTKELVAFLMPDSTVPRSVQ